MAILFSDGKFTKNPLVGVWTIQDSLSESNIKITPEKIIYPEYQKGYEYQLINPNTIKIYFTDWVFVGQYTVSNDTLIISDENSRQIYRKISK